MPDYDLGRARGRIEIDHSDLAKASAATKSFAASTSKSLAAAGASMAKTGKSLSTFVTLPILGVGVATVKLASDAAEIQNKMKETFGGMAKDIQRWSETSLDSMGLATATAQDMASTFGGLFLAAKLPGKEIAALSKQFTGLAVDAASFFNVNFDEALLSLRSGLAGEAEPLRKFHIFLNEAAVQAEAAKLGIAKMGTTLTEQQKIQARASLIIKGMGKATGDYARTAEGTANQTRTMGERMKQVGADIGKLLLPVADKLLSWARKAIDFFTKLSPAVKKLVIQILGIAAAVGPVLFILGKFLSVLSLLAAHPVIAAILAIAAAVFFISKNWEKLPDIIHKIWDKVQDFLITAWEKLKEIFPKLWERFVEIVKEFGPKVWEAFKELLAKIPELFRMLFEALPGLIEGFFRNLPTILKVIGGLIILGLWEGIKLAWGIIVAFLANLPKIILALLAGLGGLLVSLGGLLIRGLWEGIKLGWKLVLEFLKNLPKLILLALVALPGLLVALGVLLLRGLWKGITEAAKAVFEFFRGLGKKILGFLVGLPGALIAIGAALLRGLWEGIVKGFQAVVNFLRSIPGRVRDFFVGAGNWLVKAGKALIQGFINGIKSVLGAVDIAATGVGQRAIDAFNRKLETRSPSKVFYKIGQDTMQGFVNGIESVSVPVKTIVDALAALAGEEERIGKRSEAFAAMTDKLADRTRNLIQKTRDRIKQLKEEGKSTDSLKEKVKGLQNRLEKIAKVRPLINQFNAMQVQLEIVRERLEAIRTEMEQFGDDVRSGFEQATDFVSHFASAEAVSAEELEQFLRDSIAKAKEWSKLLLELQRQGLSTATLSALAAAGPGAAPLANAILQAGVGEINALQGELEGIISSTVESLQKGIFGEAVGELESQVQIFSTALQDLIDTINAKLSQLGAKTAAGGDGGGAGGGGGAAGAAGAGGTHKHHGKNHIHVNNGGHKHHPGKGHQHVGGTGHEGGLVPFSGLFNLQKGEVVVPVGAAAAGGGGGKTVTNYFDVKVPPPQTARIDEGELVTMLRRLGFFGGTGG